MAIPQKYELDCDRPVKKIVAEAVSATFRTWGAKHDDDFRNWIIACRIVEELKKDAKPAS